MPRVKPETRARIRANIERAALKVLSERGFDAAGMREIAEVAGMSPAALYNHYKSKEAVFAALVDGYRGRVLDDTVENPLRTYLENSRFPDDIEDLADALEQIVVRDKPYLLLWYVDLSRFGGAHFRGQLTPGLLLESPTFKLSLEELERSGRLSHDAEMAFKMVYVHIFNFFLVLHVFDNGTFVGGDDAKARYIKTMVDVFRHGLLR